MEHTPTSSTVVFNIGVQALNLLIFFLIFYFGFSKKISDSLQQRKELIAKLQFADDEYKSIIADAEKAAKEILSSANASKKNILEDATFLAKQKADLLMEEAENKAESLLENAQVKSNSLISELRDNYEHMVKTTAGSFLKKIFDKEPEMQTAYMEKVSKEIMN